MWFNFIILVFLTMFSTNYPQGSSVDDVKTRIIIVPFDALAFQSKIDIPIITSSNHLNSSKDISRVYNEKIVKTLSESNESFAFFSLPESEIKSLRMQAPVVFKKKPISHYGVDLSRLYQEDLIANILSNFSADYILFLCRYEITPKLFSSGKSFDGSSFVPWSLHKIDYEIYNSDKQLIALADAYNLDPKRPTDSTYLTHGVIVDGMEKSYRKLSEDMISKIENYRGEPIYKIKK